MLRALNNDLVMAVREREGREASPSAGVIDSQSVNTTDSGGVRGFDAGKKVKGRKRHIVVDTMGLLLAVLVTPAWITGHRRCVRDYERLRHHHEAVVRWSMIRITSRRLAQSR